MPFENPVSQETPICPGSFQHDPIYSLFPCGDKDSGCVFVAEPNEPVQAPPLLSFIPVTLLLAAWCLQNCFCSRHETDGENSSAGK